MTEHSCEVGIDSVEDNFDFILFDGYEKDIALDLIKKNPNAITILDAGSLKEATLELAHIVDYVVCSHDFAEDLSKVKIDYNNFDTIVSAYKELNVFLSYIKLNE